MSFVDELMSQFDARHRILLISVLAKHAGQTIYLPVESKKDRRVRAAANMISNGMSNKEIAEALRARFNVSSRQAFRDAENARKMS